MKNVLDVVEKIGSIVRSFNTNWKKGMDEINAEVMRTFSNFKQGTSILQVIKQELNSQSLFSQLRTVLS